MNPETGGTDAECALAISPEGVVINANFRPGWPDDGGVPLRRSGSGGMVEGLTKGWRWSVEHDGGFTTTRLAL